MKKKSIYLFAMLLFTLFSCNTEKSNYQNKIIEYLETNDYTGVRTDLKIKFLEYQISEVLVSDSINILEDLYKEEYEKRLKSVQHTVDIRQKNVDKYSEKQKDIVYKTLLADAKNLLKSAKEDLESVKSWKPEYLNRYDGRDPKEIIAQCIKAKLSYINPKLSNARQEIDVTFTFSPDGQKIYNFIR